MLFNWLVIGSFLILAFGVNIVFGVVCLLLLMAYWAGKDG